MASRCPVRAETALVIEIDGSLYSGSGTIVRQAVALAALTSQSVHLVNARLRRRRPGLTRCTLWDVREVEVGRRPVLKEAALGLRLLRYRREGEDRQHGGGEHRRRAGRTDVPLVSRGLAVAPGMEGQLRRAHATALEHAVHKFAYSLDGSHVLAAQPRPAAAEACVDEVHALGREGGQRNRLTDDRAAARVKRTVYFDHKRCLSPHRAARGHPRPIALRACRSPEMPGGCPMFLNVLPKPR